MDKKNTLSTPFISREKVIQDALEQLENGLPHGLETGVPALDALCRLDTKRLAIITGFPNDGKSEFVDFLITSYNKKYGYKTLVFSPENQPLSYHLAKLVSKFTNKPFDKDSISKEDATAAISYVADNFFFYDYDSVSTSSQILSAAAERINETGAKILVIDAFNKIECENEGEDTLTFISRFLDTLCTFARKQDVLIFLVAHPRKMEVVGGSYRTPSAYDINGSANFFNKSDFVIIVRRNRDKGDGTGVLVKVDKVKFANYGKQGQVELQYDVPSGNYYSSVSEDTLPDWDDDSTSPSDTEGYHPVPFSFPSVSVSEPLDVEVSLYKGVADKVGTVVNLRDFLFSSDYKEVAEDIRSYPTPQDRKERKKELKASIPCITVSGRFAERDVNHLVEPSGLICIDIDYVDNADKYAEIPSIVKSLEYVLYCGKSITGDGYFAICKIANPSRFKNHYLALEDEFRQRGIIIDKSCKDITRLRFATYDEDYYYNPCASTYYGEREEQHGGGSSTAPRAEETFFNLPDEERIRQHIAFLKERGLYLPDDYATWFRIGMSIASEFGETGRGLFHEVSALSPSKYDAYECDVQYDKILGYGSNNTCTIGTLFYLFNEAEKPCVKSL